MRQAVRQLAQQVQFKQVLIDKLTHKNALLKRLKFAAQSERYTPGPRSLLEDEIKADLAAVALEIKQLAPGQAPQQRRQPKRLPRREIHHEPHPTTCRCGWSGRLICDDFRGYKALMTAGVTEAGCLAHARRKFFDLHAAGKSQIAGAALAQLGKVYDIERELKDATADERRALRQQRTRSILEALHQRRTQQRQQVQGNSATAKALDYSLRRWQALTRFLDDGKLPIDNNWIENQIRPIAIGRNNWLFVGSLRTGQRAAAIMSLVQSARMSGHDPYQYLKGVLTRLPTHKASLISELLPHRWKASHSA